MLSWTLPSLGPLKCTAGTIFQIIHSSTFIEHIVWCWGKKKKASVWTINLFWSETLLRPNQHETIPKISCPSVCWLCVSFYWRIWGNLTHYEQKVAMLWMNKLETWKLVPEELLPHHVPCALVPPQWVYSSSQVVLIINVQLSHKDQSGGMKRDGF